MRRRNVLALAGAATLAGCSRPVDGPGTGELLTSELPLPERFRTPLPIPPVARPVKVTADTDHYLITQRVARAELIPGTKTEIWGYDGLFPGPTLRGRKGRRMVVTVRNELPVPTSTHLHGGVTPAESDGFPTDLILPAGYSPAPPGHHSAAGRRHDTSRDYTYPMTQRAATLWYHDHRMDFTGPQVWRGLAGLFLVTDEVEDALPLPRDDRDLPLMICDRSFAADGSLKYPRRDTTHPGAGGIFHAGIFGDVILVNGAPWPRAEVPAVRHRLRLVNASNARRYRLSLSAGTITQIGSDAGLLAAPLPREDVLLAPGERVDVIADFTGLPAGTEVTMANTLGDGPAGDVMRFVITGPAADDSGVPARLSAVAALERTRAVTERRFDFRFGGGLWTINNQPYDPAGTMFSAGLGTVELWRFTSDFHHPVHVHLAHFQVLSRGANGPEPGDAGWKDTVDVRPYETVQVLVDLSGHRGRYLLHCHNLEHEDMAMMANFDIV
ncbi:spore coat protein A [Actinoplanes philippinensis]|uniref:Multicopper oxidase with three cupredoxin domains (Includes cell division protein FtsP and spore coat protein CotA) n=1 Tax=Actinoplanes philippinensis TaxID=35752 RepID=A0A1I2LE64_9ACTN|nr:multicopper oxidase family protein [Actinoplanes philippinensis]GIE82365.1 spore coat protein A [Actinoplanes philippinensis]SFF75471.1 Multicopper oxidase with three cupredoxin domains (includes cell division protein FtsP and spore coat protein CotA) [Actinoplanes philippinensis]